MDDPDWVLSQSQCLLLWELKLHDLEYHQAGKIPSRGTTREQTRLVKCSTKIYPSKNTKPCILLTQSIWWWSWWVTGTGHWTLKGFGCSVVAVVGSGVSLSKPVSVREWTQGNVTHLNRQSIFRPVAVVLICSNNPLFSSSSRVKMFSIIFISLFVVNNSFLNDIFSHFH